MGSIVDELVRKYAEARTRLIAAEAERDEAYRTIAILVRRAGGKVELTDAELVDAPTAAELRVYQREGDLSGITIEVRS